MATLSRTKVVPQPTNTTAPLASQIPLPFPRDQLERTRHENQHLIQVAGLEQESVAGPSHETGGTVQPVASLENVHNDLMPSIAYVQKSCLMTLNNLLSGPARWNPIVPDRRHSMPSSPQASSAQQAELDSSSFALQTLVSNLRNREASDEMMESRLSTSDSDLVHELRVRVEAVSTTLEPADATLARALVSLLSNFNRLSAIQETSPQPSFPKPDTLLSNHLNPQPQADLFDTLKRQLSDLQTERLSSHRSHLPPGISPVLTVERALLWSKIDEELETVVAMCKERTETLPRFSLDHMPPQYDAEHFHDDNPPDYEMGTRQSFDDSKSLHSIQTQQFHSTLNARQTDEKMRLDLEAVTMAIDRLYLVAPQLHNQRVELKSSKLAELEKARREGIESGRQDKNRDTRELENILDLIDKASERTLDDQVVVLEGGMQSRLEKARLRDKAKRDAFVEQLVRHSDAGRMHAQDAVWHPRNKDPEALLTLPEFMLEAVPSVSMQSKDPQAMLTLPEFVRELPSHNWVSELDDPAASDSKGKKKSRNRSMSAPPLSWLRSSSRSSNGNHNINVSTSQSRPRSRGLNSAFEVAYVAENHENLHHILVFFTVSIAKAGVDIEAEVIVYTEHDTGSSDCLIIRSGSYSSAPLRLPAFTTPGRKEVRVQSGHYEIKLPTVSPSQPVSNVNEESESIIGADLLSAAKPTSFICSSCSLPLVQSSRITVYRDLPSEHWEELVEAWMCHADQRLHDQVVRHGKQGVWPKPNEALVGGSYLLFEESSMSQNNLYLMDELKDDNWRIVRCLCGANIGRCQEHQTDDMKRVVYRVPKYSVRPVSPTVFLHKFPLSFFIIEDMLEYVHAHASYRFVVRDDEEERPRILIWLFKPNIPMAYSLPSSRIIDKAASIQVAKVLYKLLGPSEDSTDFQSILNKYPGFPQAEYLSYPMSVCRRIAGLLKESNMAYPESLRMMTGLEVGWLHRAH